MKVVIAKVDEVFFDGQADSVTLPGVEGEMTVLPQHEPLVTTLKAGVIIVRAGEEEKKIPIENGIAEVRPDGTTVIL